LNADIRGGKSTKLDFGRVSERSKPEKRRVRSLGSARGAREGVPYRNRLLEVLKVVGRNLAWLLLGPTLICFHAMIASSGRVF
jgi:hypothetical protein